VGLGLWWLSYRTVPERTSALEFDTCVLVDDNAGVLRLRSSHSPTGAKKLAPQGQSEGEEETEPFSATVRPPRSLDASRADPIPDQRTREATDPSARGNPYAGGASGSGNRDGVGAYFGQAAKGQSVVFVIDRSLSMGLSGALRLAKRETAACLEQLSPAVKFQVIFYNRHAEPLRMNGSSQLRAAEPEYVTEVKHLIENLRAEGGTDHLRALKEAIHLKPDVIFMVTDADGLTQETVDGATRINNGKASIYCIEVTNGSDDRASPIFRRLAEANRGAYRLVNVRHSSDETNGR
jgi:hypothetical protein